MVKNDLTWDDLEKDFNITSEEEEEIKLEMDLIRATIEARKKAKLSQRELSKKSGIKQPYIAKIESLSHSPQVTTLIKLLYPIGYTIRVMPIDKKESIK